ncbi:hypothetical protein PILCRDRAFT_825790 [Piloderma croceum F 1598]|uniref:Uncharacterized protein n=1 Tax=Piloderma croceum (strain F 1598) TaxID=765440 RepID=A0A0C3FAY7_PILCF|nr:hypothetical protein PILCRDRAFT_825790 [Piloderma croceum F 1598]
MKFTFVIAMLAALLVVEAVPVETNAQRMARGLPPLYPQNLKRGTPVDVARRGGPSKRAAPIERTHLSFVDDSMSG